MMLYYIILNYIIRYYIILYYNILYYIKLYQIILYYIILYYIKYRRDHTSRLDWNQPAQLSLQRPCGCKDQSACCTPPKNAGWHSGLSENRAPKGLSSFSAWIAICWGWISLDWTLPKSYQMGSIYPFIMFYPVYKLTAGHAAYHRRVSWHRNSRTDSGRARTWPSRSRSTRLAMRHSVIALRSTFASVSVAS